MPKFPRQRRPRISDLPFSTAQAFLRTRVCALLLSLLLEPAFPAFPASLSPVAPYLLQEQIVVSMRCLTDLVKALNKQGSFICGHLPFGAK